VNTDAAPGGSLAEFNSNLDVLRLLVRLQATDTRIQPTQCLAQVACVGLRVQSTLEPANLTCRPTYLSIHETNIM